MIGASGFSKSEKYAVLPLRDIVVFPHMIVPLFVGREKSVQALEHVMRDDKKILLVTQKSAGDDDPKPEDLYGVGTIGTILQMLKLPDGTVKVLVEGESRAEVSKLTMENEFIEGAVKPLKDDTPETDELEALARAVMGQFEQYVKLHKKIPPEVIIAVNQIEAPSKMADTMASHLVIKLSEKQELLEIVDTGQRLEKIYALMESEIGVLQVEKRIRTRVKKQMEKTQRDYYLNEQMKAIKKELSDDGDGEFDELDELGQKIDDTKLSKQAREKSVKELKKLKRMNPMSAEATVVRNYLDWIISVPWKKRSRVKKDLKGAVSILNKDHYGLEKVKDRILEYLAVQERTKKVKGPILCLVGPPGVGKTSLGQSIAKATGRNFVRMSLGGVRDESEIRGHRRTYIGAMPGKVIQGMKKAQTSNPLFLLDEIDKLGSDWRGDPSSALLEVLDPEQNESFQDHYLEVDYDLSDVMFVCTANNISNMPTPLLDRMEIIRLSGYTEDEKLEIAKRHLIKKQMKAAGLKASEFSISDKALRDLIRYYTREAGVRNLEREIAGICRKALKDILMKGKSKVSVTPKRLEKYAGIRKYRFGSIEEQNRVGVVNGLAYTQVGGDLLSVEAVVMPGKDGKVSTTGNIKDVMKESITVAEMLVKSRAPQFGLDYEDLQKKQIHVHVPEGATPKDGPSAGAAMVTAILSALTGIEIHNDIAMTGEVNLRGNVTAIGGLKEKLLAALRGGITKVLIPEENAKDLPDIPKNVKQAIEIVPVKTIDEVLAHALVDIPKPLDTKKIDNFAEIPAETAENSEKSVIHH